MIWICRSSLKNFRGHVISCTQSPASLWLCDGSASNRNVVVRIWIHSIKKPEVRVLDGPPPPRACNPKERDCKMLCEKTNSFNKFSQLQFLLCISGCAADVNGSTYGAVMFFYKAGGLCICPGMHSLINQVFLISILQSFSTNWLIVNQVTWVIIRVLWLITFFVDCRSPETWKMHWFRRFIAHSTDRELLHWLCVEMMEEICQGVGK